MLLLYSAAICCSLNYAIEIDDLGIKPTVLITLWTFVRKTCWETNWKDWPCRMKLCEQDLCAVLAAECSQWSIQRSLRKTVMHNLLHTQNQKQLLVAHIYFKCFLSTRTAVFSYPQIHWGDASLVWWSLVATVGYKWRKEKDTTQHWMKTWFHKMLTSDAWSQHPW